MKYEDLLESAGETTEYAKIFVEQKIEYFRLESAKRIAKTTSNLVTVAVLGFIVFIAIIFLTFAIGLLLGDYLDSYGIAFLIVTLFYVLCGMLVFYFKKYLITNPIVKLVIKEMLD